jgi:hypothetical protein
VEASPTQEQPPAQVRLVHAVEAAGQELGAAVVPVGGARRVERRLHEVDARSRIGLEQRGVLELGVGVAVVVQRDGLGRSLA